MRVIEDNYTVREVEFECCECRSKLAVKLDDVTRTGGRECEVYWICPLCCCKNYADSRDWTGYDY